jgi:hypothetical protein
MGTTTDWVTNEAKAPPAKLAMADAAEGEGAHLPAGSAAHALVFSRVVKYNCGGKFAHCSPDFRGNLFLSLVWSAPCYHSIGKTLFFRV